jgi:hypothetical protein
MASQRKDELLKELDVALNRKVQEKYYKHAKTQQLPVNAAHIDVAADKIKRESQYYDAKHYKVKEHLSKSPVHFKKSAEKESVVVSRVQKSNDH